MTASFPHEQLPSIIRQSFPLHPTCFAGILLSKGGRNMFEKRDEWCFLRLRAAQLFEEGNVKAALKLMKTINQEQIRKLDETKVKYERIENC